MRYLKSIFMLLALALTAVSASAAQHGDINNDGEVGISDLNALIDMILADNTSFAGDVNGDGEVNIADINALIDMLLS